MLRVLQVVGMIAVVTAGTVGMAGAEDAFFRVDIRDLELTEGKLPDPDDAEASWRLRWQLRESMQPYAVLDGPGEVYASADPLRLPRMRVSSRGRRDAVPDYVAVRTAAGKEVTGRLFWPKPDLSGMVAVRFRIPASRADAEDRADFYRAKLAHYDELLNREAPGAAWFRHQTREARKELNSDEVDEPARRNRTWRRTRELNDTYALFTGGRAMSENLQLDRVLPEPGKSTEMVELDSIRGITVAEIDWEELTKDLNPQLDPLGAEIPFDQHAVFFPSFTHFVAMIDEAKAQSGPILQMMEPRGEDAGTFARYERQLGLSITGVARLLGPRLAKSVAMTGSDPYFRTGTDVAFLFEAVEPQTLRQMLLTQVSAAATNVRQVERMQGEIGGIEYVGFRSPDRTICSYVGTFGKAVVVTNSPHQLEQLARVHGGAVKPIAALAEYKFFRDRYRRGDAEETAFVFMSDATIRRWCGPRWRILTSRRTRDVAVMAELQATHMDRLAQGGFAAGPIYTDLPLAAEGEMRLSPEGVQSAAVGSLAFMRPIAEMPIRKVTKAEAQAYERWRDGYERNWTGVFDPIGLRVGVRKDSLSADLSVMPLIGGSDYRRMIAVSRGAKIAPGAGDPHDALAHFVLAVNKDSEPVQGFGNLAAGMMGSTNISPLGWLGEWVTLYFDDDPLWAEMAQVPYDERGEFFQKNLGRIPVALVVDVESGFKLTAFLTGLRAFIEQTAPGMTHWESLSYKDEPYVKITPSDRAKRQDDDLENLSICYSASGESLIVTLSEDLLKRALDRRLARRTAKEEGKTIEAEPAWLGESLCLKADAKAVAVLSAIMAEDYRLAMQKRAWANLPILNEWRRRYSDKDPVELHQRVWKIRLIDPAGGRYHWNAKWQTMESTVYGHPGEPKKGPAAPPLLSGIVGGNFGLTFENQGLRARVKLRRKAD